MAKRIVGTTPQQDGYRMPGEFEEQEQIWMLWPWRNDNWRQGAKPAQKIYVQVAKAISAFEPVTICVPPMQFENAVSRIDEVNNGSIRVVEMTNDDAWMRDSGPSFVINDNGGIRAVDWEFNAWGALTDGLYFPWHEDELVARKVCEIAGVDSYKTKGFVLEGGSFHVDGEGTAMVTEMCLLHPSRNPSMNKEQIEEMLKSYLNCQKIIWVKEGIDPDETNGHIDDVACFVAPGEAACIYTEDTEHPFYKEAQEAYHFLCGQTDAKGRKLKVHKMCVTKSPCYLKDTDSVDHAEGTIPRKEGEIAIASYLNFLIINGAVILPQYGDENDALAVEQAQSMFSDRRIVGVQTIEIAYGGGNIHCITQQQPKVK